MPFPSLSSPPAIFPIYLVPSLNFRRRKSSTDSNVSTSTSASEAAATAAANDSSDTVPPSFLTGHTSHLRCARCLSDLALSDQVISKGFTGRHGRAYLVSPSISAISPTVPLSAGTAKAKNDALPNLPNTFTHRPVPRQLVTGSHTVSDISCAQCGSVLGWKYVAAEEEAQKYKVGKFILETKRVCRSSRWEDAGVEENGGIATRSGFGNSRKTKFEEDDVEFDSQDDDECEDLFMGVWTPQTAMRRRRMKMFGQSDK